mmetsp:Transcript_8363/g.24009  ORF Transcript_8363/g.24009 Transcript_8363/m.24009 type:complete len:308 (+) Transcript_8363:645-1568(+)
MSIFPALSPCAATAIASTIEYSVTFLNAMLAFLATNSWTPPETSRSATVLRSKSIAVAADSTHSLGIPACAKARRHFFRKAAHGSSANARKPPFLSDLRMTSPCNTEAMRMLNGRPPTMLRKDSVTCITFTPAMPLGNSTAVVSKRTAATAQASMATCSSSRAAVLYFPLARLAATRVAKRPSDRMAAIGANTATDAAPPSPLPRKDVTRVASQRAPVRRVPNIKASSPIRHVKLCCSTSWRMPSIRNSAADKTACEPPDTWCSNMPGCCIPEGWYAKAKRSANAACRESSVESASAPKRRKTRTSL